MFRHNSIGTDVHGKALGQFKQAFFNPPPPVFEGASGKVILATQKGPAHAAGDAMVVRCGFEADKRLAGFGHRPIQVVL